MAKDDDKKSSEKPENEDATTSSPMDTSADDGKPTDAPAVDTPGEEASTSSNPSGKSEATSPEKNSVDNAMTDDAPPEKSSSSTDSTSSSAPADSSVSSEKDASATDGANVADNKSKSDPQKSSEDDEPKSKSKETVPKDTDSESSKEKKSDNDSSAESGEASAKPASPSPQKKETPANGEGASAKKASPRKRRIGEADSAVKEAAADAEAPARKRRRRRSRWHKNRVPDILRNMPSGLNEKFGTADNTVRRYRLKKGAAPPAGAAQKQSATRGLEETAAFGRVNRRATPFTSRAGGPAGGAAGGRGGGAAGMYNPEYYHNQGNVQALSTTNVYVGGIPRHFTEKEIYQIFAAYGKLKSVYITKVGTVSFVEFENTADAQRAIGEQNAKTPPTGKYPWVVKFANYNTMVSSRQQTGLPPVPGTKPLEEIQSAAANAGVGRGGGSGFAGVAQRGYALGGGGRF